jgi:exo-beta-1,3-glucanase (GH17 family)
LACVAFACTRVDARIPDEAIPAPSPLTWEEKLARIRWVAYAPPSANPEVGVEASEEAIRDDIALLVRAGFTGLVTYGSAGTLGRYVPQIAQSAGIQGMIMGIWDPADAEEIAKAEAAASLSVVVGFCVGNEGIPGRYTIATLSATIERLQESTGKPVATTEEIDDYADPALLQLGNWVFPNVHPYFHDHREPGSAVGWTKAAYDELVRRAGERFVLLKEVGLPTTGDPENQLSEKAQQQYYEVLAETNVRFVYFEAFDQPWKTHLPIEPHWGIFRADRSPKLLGTQLLQNWA